jgi:hypothetical protein
MRRLDKQWAGHIPEKDGAFSEFRRRWGHVDTSNFGMFAFNYCKDKPAQLCTMLV